MKVTLYCVHGPYIQCHEACVYISCIVSTKYSITKLKWSCFKVWHSSVWKPVYGKKLWKMRSILFSKIFGFVLNQWKFLWFFWI